MEEIKVGDKVRIIAEDYVKAFRWEPSNSSKHGNLIKAEHLKDKVGIVIPTMRELPDYEVFVKLDNGWTVIISKSHLTPVPPLNQ